MKEAGGPQAEGKLKCEPAAGGRARRGEPIRLGIDAVGALHGGAEQIALGAVRAAIEDERVRKVVVFASPSPARQFAFPRSEKLTLVEVRRAGGGVERIAWWCAGAPNACMRNGVSHVLFLNGAGLTDEGVRKVLFVQQSLPFVSEAQEVFGPARRIRYRLLLSMMRWSASSADLVAVQTETMRELVADELDFEAERIRVIRAGLYEAPPARTDDRERGGKGGGPVRLLYVGNAFPHKNLRVIPVALDVLRRIGQRAELVATLEPGEGLPVRDDIRALGYLDRSRLMEEMRQADCFVMPSLAETVCLPLVEAMGLSVPVVVAERPYAREVCGEAASYFDPGDGNALAYAVLTVLRDKAATEVRVAEGVRRARTFESPDSFRTLIGAALGSA